MGYADYVPSHIDERATGVTGVDGGVGLDETLKLLGKAGLRVAVVNGTVLGRDDAGGDGLRETERAADGKHPVADFGGLGVAEFDGRQRGIGVVLDDGDVGLGIDADDSRGAALEALSIVGIAGELDVDLVGLVDDVIVGDDVAARVNDEAGAESLALAAYAVKGSSLSPPPWPAEELVEEVLHIPLAGVATVGIGVAPGAAALGSDGRLLGDGLSVFDIHNCGRTYLALTIEEKPAPGQSFGVGDDEWPAHPRCRPFAALWRRRRG